MKMIASAGGNSFSFENVDSLDIEKVFDRIEASIGLRKRALILRKGNQAFIAQQTALELRVSKRKFFCLFTLDKSGSMAGIRWKKTTSAVRSFIGRLETDDIFGLMTFDNRVQFLTGTAEN